MYFFVKRNKLPLYYSHFCRLSPNTGNSRWSCVLLPLHLLGAVPGSLAFWTSTKCLGLFCWSFLLATRGTVLKLSFLPIWSQSPCTHHPTYFRIWFPATLFQFRYVLFTQLPAQLVILVLTGSSTSPTIPCLQEDDTQPSCVTNHCSALYGLRLLGSLMKPKKDLQITHL